MKEEHIKQIIEKYNTPAYIFDINKAQKRIKYLREQLPQNVQLCYAIKANTFIIKD